MRLGHHLSAALFAAVASFGGATGQPAAGEGPIPLHKLPLPLRHSVKAHGEGLDRPGKERLTLTGAITRGSDPAKPFAAIHELPGNLRIEQAGHLLTAVAAGGVAAGAGLGATDQALVESLLDDSPEEFLVGQSQGVPTRLLGSRFRAAGPAGGGPYYDIYAVHRPTPQNGRPGPAAKRFYVNSETLLVERGLYAGARGGRDVQVETRFESWQKAGGRRYPGLITRFEDGSPVFRITTASAALSPKASDGLFGGPQ